MVTPALRRLDDCSVDNLNSPRICAVAACHLLIHLTDSTIERDVAILLVHVVRVGAALVAKPDGVVLDLHGTLLEDLVHREQFSTASLGFVQALHEVPPM